MLLKHHPAQHSTYSKKPSCGALLLLRLILLTFLISSSCLAAQGDHQGHSQDKGLALQQQLPENQSAASPAESIMAGLSDEQARQMLLDELQKEHTQSPGLNNNEGLASLFHHVLDALTTRHRLATEHLLHLWTGVTGLEDDLVHVFTRLCPVGSTEGAIRSALWVIFYLSVGGITEALFRYLFITKYLVKVPELSPMTMKSSERLISAIINVVPRVIGVVIFFAAAYFSFMFFIWTDLFYVQIFFLAILLGIVAIRVVIILSHILFSPQYKNFRLVPVDCPVAKTIHFLIVATFSYIILTVVTAVVLKRLGADITTIRLIQLVSVTLLLTITATAALVFRKKIRTYLLTSAPRENDTLSWGRQQFAEVWHILTIIYLVFLWFLLLNDLADPTYNNRGAFIPSFFIVPIWMAADKLIQWLVLYTMKLLQIYQEQYDPPEPANEEAALQRKKGRAVYLKVKAVARGGVIVLILVWVASLWDIRVPLISQLAAVLLDAILIMTVAVILWQFISSWIERKIQESMPEGEEEEESDDEWGGAASRGRAYTLLPMVRKFIGSVLVVMVSMTVLSSAGVDIGPLLAGAGVIGLAIGFGAQKLVADMFSGFFYLLDDAFRVGEYIEAGEISGTVESITLRNVMMRHHRGMLQIVPHSDLGAITNFMRGGITVKFNLDFPYDAPIDKIRKVIKKVGQKMLENEEYGKDFIRPVKSQGVREISNSVMTIRVKFTAQPGTHFVIRREAYRLITEALNAQNIFYAHRKVIVDMPEFSQEREQITPDAMKKIRQAAGAAAMGSEEEGEQEQNTPQGSDAI